MTEARRQETRQRRIRRGFPRLDRHRNAGRTRVGDQVDAEGRKLVGIDAAGRRHLKDQTQQFEYGRSR